MYKNSLYDIKRFSAKQLLLLYVNELDLWLKKIFLLQRENSKAFILLFCITLHAQKKRKDYLSFKI